jgi:hypothetical protein
MPRNSASSENETTVPDGPITHLIVFGAIVFAASLFSCDRCVKIRKNTIKRIFQNRIKRSNLPVPFHPFVCGAFPLAFASECLALIFS